jgi:predicted RNase H-like nuclease
MDTIAGVDGCKGGWLVAITERWPNARPELTFCPTFSDVICKTASCNVTVIDIPIGLLDGESERVCDPQAREALADKQIPNTHSRVFRAPPRSALHVFDPVNGWTTQQQWTEFQKAIRTLTHKSPTKQAFDFSAKVKDVDDAMDPELQKRILEFHPEAAWKRMAERTLQSKHTASGLLRRFNLLHDHGADWVPSLVNDPVLKRVKLDDLFDALLGLFVADGISRYSMSSDRATEVEDGLGLNRFPKGKPEIDAVKHLRMEIWY